MHFSNMRGITGYIEGTPKQDSCSMSAQNAGILTSEVFSMYIYCGCVGTIPTQVYQLSNNIGQKMMQFNEQLGHVILLCYIVLVAWLWCFCNCRSIKEFYVQSEKYSAQCISA